MDNLDTKPDRAEPDGAARHDSDQFETEIGDENFNFARITFDDRKVVGAQIAEAVGAHPLQDFVILQQLKTFELETLRPTEVADLTTPSRFFVIKGDGTDRFVVDGLSLEWPREVVTGFTVKRLVGKDDDDIELVFERENEPDKVLDDEDEVRIGAGGVERFKTRPAHVHLTIIVNTRRKEWTKKKISFEELVRIAYPVPPDGQNIVYTVTYFDGPPHHPEGTLTEGKSVKVKDEMVFNVKFTDKS